MLSADEHPGVFYFMVGIVAVVMAGVGLSLLVDRRFKFSSGIGEIRRDIISHETELHSLKLTRDPLSRKLTGPGASLQAQALAYQELVGRAGAVRLHLAELEDESKRLRNAVSALEEDFSRCREDYRSKTWGGAIGENVGDLKTLAGREYLKVTIARVTDVGLEIRHSHGFARIQAPDLDASWQNRFQWSDAARRKLLQEELTDLQSEGAGVVDRLNRPSAADPMVVNANNSREDLTKLRHEVIGWQEKVKQFNDDYLDAKHRADFGRLSSVPGSLETWKSQAARLAGGLIRARNQLNAAKLRLSIVSPDDLLLKPESSQ